jgi:nicotinamide riboside transporter PnuC
VTLIEILAASFGIAGTLLLAFNGQRAGWGFVSFLASNAFWITFALQHEHWGLLAQQVCFTITSCLGVWVWLIKPMRQLHDLADCGETVITPGDVYTELLAAHSRIAELERHLEMAVRRPIERRQ